MYLKKLRELSRRHEFINKKVNAMALNELEVTDDTKALLEKLDSIDVELSNISHAIDGGCGVDTSDIVHALQAMCMTLREDSDDLKKTIHCTLKEITADILKALKSKA